MTEKSSFKASTRIMRRTSISMSLHDAHSTTQLLLIINHHGIAEESVIRDAREMRRPLLQEEQYRIDTLQKHSKRPSNGTHAFQLQLQPIQLAYGNDNPYTLKRASQNAHKLRIHQRAHPQSLLLSTHSTNQVVFIPSDNTPKQCREWITMSALRISVSHSEHNSPLK